MKTAHSMAVPLTVLSGVPQARRHRSPDRTLSALIAGLIALLFAKLTLADPAYVQGHYESTLVPRHKMTVVYTDAQQAGDLNVVVVGWRVSGYQLIIVTDTNNNGYSASPQITSSDGQLSESIFIARNIAPALPRANTVTVKFSSDVTSDVRALEYSGVTVFANGGSAESGTGDWARSGNVTISQVPALLVAATMVGPGDHRNRPHRRL